MDPHSSMLCTMDLFFSCELIDVLSTDITVYFNNDQSRQQLYRCQRMTVYSRTSNCTKIMPQIGSLLLNRLVILIAVRKCLAYIFVMLNNPLHPTSSGVLPIILANVILSYQKRGHSINLEIMKHIIADTFFVTVAYHCCFVQR